MEPGRKTGRRLYTYEFMAVRWQLGEATRDSTRRNTDSQARKGNKTNKPD